MKRLGWLAAGWLALSCAAYAQKPQAIPADAPRAADGRIIIPAPPGTPQGCEGFAPIPIAVVDNYEINFCFYVESDRLQYELVTGSGASMYKSEITAGPHVYVALLTDRRFETFWPQIEAALGPDGEVVRSRALERAQQAYANRNADGEYDTTAGSMSTQRERRTLEYASSLARWGDTAAAIAVLDRNLPARRRNGSLRDDDQYAWVINRQRAASLLRNAGRTDEALALLDAVIAAPFISFQYRLNARVNRAALMAETGNAEEALAAIRQTFGDFRSQPEQELALRGSRRQFDWIEACALHRLGRVEEARTLLDNLGREDPYAGNPMGSADPTESIVLRAALCIGDSQRIEAFLVDQLAAGIPWAGASLTQPSAWMQRASAAIGPAIEAAIARTGHPGLRPMPAQYRWMADPATLRSADPAVTAQ